jgi:hypothetical protein
MIKHAVTIDEGMMVGSQVCATSGASPCFLILFQYNANTCTGHAKYAAAAAGERGAGRAGP